MKTFNYFVDVQRSAVQNAFTIVASLPSYSLIRQPKNISFHNLCLASTVLPPLKQLLGLGLNFCPAPPTNTKLSQTGIEKFSRDYRTKLFFADMPKPFIREDREEDSSKLLYLPNIEWKPPEPINPELSLRETAFSSQLENLFSPKRKLALPSKLLPNQSFAMEWLKQNENIVVFSSDKNLGPCVIERDRYVEFAFKFHLSDNNTYRRLSLAETRLLRKEMIQKIESFITIFANVLSKSDKTFLQRSLDNVAGTGLSYLYQLAKIHKNTFENKSHHLLQWFLP